MATGAITGTGTFVLTGTGTNTLGTTGADNRIEVKSNATYQIRAANSSGNAFHFGATSGTADGVFSNNAGTEIMRITNGGNVGIGLTPSYQIELSTDSAGKPTSSVWTIVSDEKTKKNISRYEAGLAAIRQVHIHEFDYTGEYGQPPVHTIGPLAGEIKELFPRSVTTVQKRRTPQSAPEPISTFNAHELFMANIEAVIELDRQVQVLQAQINTLLEAAASKK
jgi:hypothetical protein